MLETILGVFHLLRMECFVVGFAGLAIDSSYLEIIIDLFTGYTPH